MSSSRDDLENSKFILLDSGRYGVATVIRPNDEGGWDLYSNAGLLNVGVLVKATGGQIGGWYIYNAGAARNIVKIYNTSEVPTAAMTPKLRLPLAPGAAANLTIEAGLDGFPDGIGIRASAGIPDSDNTAPGTNEVIVNLWYR